MRNRLQWVNSLQLAGGYHLDLGAQYRHEEGESIGYLEFFGQQLPTDFDLDRTSRGLFASLKAQPSDALLLQGSVRYEDPDDFDDGTSVQLGV